MKLRMRDVLSVVLAGGLLCGSAIAADSPFILGISTHLMNYERSAKKPLTLAADAGFNALKDDVFWSTAEPQRNRLRIMPQWRSYLDTASGLNMSRLAILGYGTPYHKGAKPRTPEVTKDWLRYVDYVSRQLGNRVNYYEIWNEWDLEAPKDRQLSLDYAKLVQETAPLLRKNTQSLAGTPAKILAGAVTPDGMRFGFADSLIESGALDLMDGLSVHPYAHCAANDGNTPEAWVRWMSDYERHIRSKAGRDVPLYLTEMAWPSHQGPCGKSEVTQAVYMARIFFLARTVPNVKGMWWYDLYNDGPDRYDQEHNFGVLHEDLSPKPAYTMMRAIAPIVRDFSYDAQASVLSENLYQLYFQKGSERVLVAWAIGKPREERIVTTQAMSGPVRLTDTVKAEQGLIDSDRQWRCENDQCSTSMTLTNFPKIIRLSP